MPERAKLFAVSHKVHTLELEQLRQPTIALEQSTQLPPLRRYPFAESQLVHPTALQLRHPVEQVVTEGQAFATGIYPFWQTHTPTLKMKPAAASQAVQSVLVVHVRQPTMQALQTEVPLSK